MSRTGAYTLADLQQFTNITAISFGLDAIQDIVRAEFLAHDQLMMDMFNQYATPTTAREEADGLGQILDGEFEEADEFSRVRTQKITGGQKLGFPLRKFQFANGWTLEYLERATVAHLAVQALNVQQADVRNKMTYMKKALFSPTNYTFRDSNVTEVVDIGVKALLNGDGSIPPNGPNGETFNGNHTHYVGATTLTTAALDALILNVTEHTSNANVQIHINQAQEAGIRGLTGFIAAWDARIAVANTVTMTNQRLDNSNTQKRFIGFYNGAEVFVKPWVYASYIVAIDVNAPTRVLRMRNPVENASGLHLAGRVSPFPLQSEYFQSFFGFGVKNRGAAAILYIGNTTYADPT
mgnify:CR=1 FL=1